MRLIDADALKDDLEYEWDHNDSDDFANKCVWRVLEDAPTINQQRWIPVDERMPERNKMDSTGKYREAYLVTTGFMTFTARFNEYGYWVLWGYQQVLKNIIAWMPLPDPYKEEE